MKLPFIFLKGIYVRLTGTKEHLSLFATISLSCWWY